MSNTGSLRELLTGDQFAALNKTGTIIVNDRRRRPRYFDGRFLAARDLTSDQEYFLTRQADLGRLGGSGVISGLGVSASSTSATALTVAAGYGITSSGELIVVGGDVAINIADLAEQQRLDASFGLLPIPRDPGRNRTGVYVIALRPVEFTANPIASYPTSITGPREAKDGDIVEGAAVTLIPYPESGSTRDYDQLRSRVAYSIFVQNGTNGVPVDALPIAVVAIERGVIRWIDPYLVRREVGADHLDVLGLSGRHRATAEAQLLQYDLQLGDVLRTRAATNRPANFAASEHFQALPSIGRVPVSALNPADFTQYYFPSEYTVDLTIVPDDELPSLVDEALGLPPLDLTATVEERSATSVVVMVPVPRASYRTYVARLASPNVTLKPAVTGSIARRLPIDVLRGLRLPILTPPVLVGGGDAVWRELLQSTSFYWYARRRNVPYAGTVVGIPSMAVTNEQQVETAVIARLGTLGFGDYITTLRTQISLRALGELLALLNGPRFADPILASAIMNDFKSGATPPDRVAIAAAAARWGDAQLGDGLARLKALSDALGTPAVVTAIETSGAVPQLDRVLRSVPDATVTSLGTQLKTIAGQPNPAKATSDLAITQLGSLPQ